MERYKKKKWTEAKPTLTHVKKAGVVGAGVVGAGVGFVGAGVGVVGAVNDPTFD